MPDSPLLDRSSVFVSAFMCQEVIRESGSNNVTAVRIINAFQVAPSEVPVKNASNPDSKIFVYPLLEVHVVVIVYSVEPSEFRLTMRGFRPDGSEMTPERIDGETAVSTGGEALGTVINIGMHLPTDKAGDFWFEVYLNEKFATKVPLKIIHAKPIAAVPSGQGNAPSGAASATR